MTKKYKFLFHNIIAAPFDGFYEMRRMRKGNVWFVVLMYALYVLLQIIAYNFTGYLVNTNNPNNFNILKSIGSSLLPFLNLYSTIFFEAFEAPLDQSIS